MFSISHYPLRCDVSPSLKDASNSVFFPPSNNLFHSNCHYRNNALTSKLCKHLECDVMHEVIVCAQVLNFMCCVSSMCACVFGRFLAVIAFTMLSSCNIFFCLPISQRIMAQITFQVNHSGTFPDVYITFEHQRGLKTFPLRYAQRAQTLKPPIPLLEPTSSRFAFSQWSVPTVQVRLVQPPHPLFWLWVLYKNSCLCV